MITKLIKCGTVLFLLAAITIVGFEVFYFWTQHLPFTLFSKIFAGASHVLIFAILIFFLKEMYFLDR